MSKKDVMTFSKGVSDLETFVNYFALPERIDKIDGEDFIIFCGLLRKHEL